MHRRSAAAISASVARLQVAPSAFRAALTSVPVLDRDAWLDTVLGLDALPEDSPELPRDCIPYLPCPVDTLVRASEHAGIGPADVFVDVGAGVGRAAVLMHLLTGASAVGVEIQRDLVAASRALTTRLNISRVSVLEGDAVQLIGSLTTGTVFFLYCPFGGQRLERVLDDLEPMARARPIRVCSVNLPLPSRRWLPLERTASGDLSVYRSSARG